MLGEEDEDPKLCQPDCVNAGGVNCHGSTQCIWKNQVCNGVVDCDNQEDEKNCCGKDGHSCGDGTCIPSQWVNNDVEDCADGSDEESDWLSTILEIIFG